MAIEDGIAGESWSAAEVEATVLAYLRMLRMQELGQTFVKAQVIRQLANQLPARNTGAIEYKFRNISAVLHALGVQSVSGYKPLANVQKLLIDVVGDLLQRDLALDQAAIRSVETAAEPPLITDFEDFVVGVPSPKYRVNDAATAAIQRVAVKRDYLEREARNRSLGHAGELVVMEFEARRLFSEGAKRLIDRIEHTSRLKGDGLGYDVLSYDADGRERFIEVKTTSYDAETPFFVSSNEAGFSEEAVDQFHLYRLFDFRKNPRMFALNGPISASCLLDPVSYRATLLGS